MKIKNKLKVFKINFFLILIVFSQSFKNFCGNASWGYFNNSLDRYFPFISEIEALTGPNNKTSFMFGILFFKFLAHSSTSNLFFPEIIKAISFVNGGRLELSLKLISVS